MRSVRLGSAYVPRGTSWKGRGGEGSRARSMYRVVLLLAIALLSLLALLIFFLPSIGSASSRTRRVAELRQDVRAHDGTSEIAHAKFLHEVAQKIVLDEAIHAEATPQEVGSVSAKGSPKDTDHPNAAVTLRIPADDRHPLPHRQRHDVHESLQHAATYDQLLLGALGCQTAVDGNNTAAHRPGDTIVRFYRTSPSGSAIVELVPIFPGHDQRYFPLDALVLPEKRNTSRITLLSDSLRIVATTSDAPSDPSAVDARVVCNAEGFRLPSQLSWGYDRQDDAGTVTTSSNVRIRMSATAADPHRPQNNNDVTATLEFSESTSLVMHGLASRGAGVQLEQEDEVQLRNLDVNHYRLDRHANLYGSVPLVYVTDLKPSRPYTFGVLWLTGASLRVQTHRSSTTGNIRSMSFVGDGGTGRLYLLPGPTSADVLRQYFMVTGFPQLPPLFGLGYHQSRWNYRDQADTLDVNRRFEEHRIPVDTIWLDIDHTNDRRYFTWDALKFPNSLDMINELVRSGRKLVTITDPHIKVDPSYFVYQGAARQKLFVTRSVHDHNEFHGHCWPGESAWVDFANPRAREWYATLFDPEHYVGSTNDVFSWIDMNEPSVFSGPDITLPGDVGQFDGVQWYPHRELHNTYGFFHSAATFAGHLYRSHGKQRPFLLSRSFFPGSQRFAAVWTGDNQAQWSHLKGSIAMLLMHSMSGIVFIGADVGGFFDDPDEELHVRWYQLGCLYPFFRGHSHEHTRRREPWLYSDATREHIAHAIRFRYILLPYLYALFYEAHRDGTAIWRPRMFEFPQEVDTYTNVDEDETFFVGRALLAIPAVHRDQRSVSTTLPKGSSFVDFWTGDGYSGGAHVNLVVPRTNELLLPQQSLTSPVVPLLQRAGTAIPTLASVDDLHSSSRWRSDAVRLVAALDDQCSASGFLYHDDGVSTAFATDHFFCARVVTVTRGVVSPTAPGEKLLVKVRRGPGCPTTTTTRSGQGNASMPEYRFVRISHVRLLTARCSAVVEASTVRIEQIDAMSLGNAELQRVQASWSATAQRSRVIELSGGEAPLDALEFDIVVDVRTRS